LKQIEQVLAFGTERFAVDPAASRQQREERSRYMLARALNLRTAIAFVGSGCSAPLGYPTWKKLVCDVIKETADRHPKTELETRLRGIHSRLLATDFPVARDLIFYLGLCQSYVDVHSLIFDAIGKAAKAADRGSSHNPYRALRGLPIERFVTSNYDLELEAMIDPEGDGQYERSLTQEGHYHGSLAALAVVGSPDLRDAVFHCHGRFDVRESIIASEADYQQWYLTQRDPTASTFRQSLDLLFGSNPVLFLGFGMEDDDLLRPLRVFNADNPERKESRLLFALNESGGTPREIDWMDSVHDRYGVHFICYPRPAGDDRARGQALCHQIAALAQQWQTYLGEWTEKPVIRRVHVSVSAKGDPPRKKAPYQHYSVVMSGDDDLAPERTREDVETLLGHIRNERTRVVVVTGDGGSGKSWRVLHLLRRLRDERTPRTVKDGTFFWSSYYADDWLTGLDRALSYFEKDAGEPPRREKRRLERFKECLHDGSHLLVFDGFERLLRQTDPTKPGVPYSHSVRELLDIVSEHTAAETRSTVILTTRLMPEQLAAKIPAIPTEDDVVKHFGVRRLTTDDLKEGKAFRLDEDQLGIVCSLCGGHSYALLLAARYFAKGGSFEKFVQEISRRAPDSRNSAVIKLAIDAVDRRTDGMAMKALERLAVFMSPVDAQTREVCFEAAGGPARSSADNERVLQELLSSKLLLEVVTDPPESGRRGPLVTVHPTVRSYVFYKRHGVVTDALPNFTLAGFTSGTAACHPGDERGERQITELFNLFCDRSFEAVDFESQRSMARAAFGVMRSRMDSNTVPRWTTYEKYIRLGLRLMYRVKITSKSRWTYQDRALGSRRQSDDGILYADELAWLYNDIGLALCSEGSMADAYSLWEQGFEIDRVTDSEEDGGQYMVQSHLHMSHLFIELGRLRRAAQFLATTERANAIYGDPDFAARILGYRGLVAHLAGNLDEAEKLYSKAIAGLTARGRRNLRAESLFRRYRADLKMAGKKLEHAEEQVEIALSLAREGNFPDLEAYARKSRAHVWREQKKEARIARAEYEAAMATAKVHGIKRLQADIHSELARLALDVGDWETARIRAMESLTLANELSLGLRRTHGLVVLGLAMEAGGNRELAVSYLQHALALANLQGYHLRGREAEVILQRLGASETPAKPQQAR
jgi:tetratricopeptide (TPR) repeat protein